jgi:hypothetical protein
MALPEDSLRPSTATTTLPPKSIDKSLAESEQKDDYFISFTIRRGADKIEFDAKASVVQELLKKSKKFNTDFLKKEVYYVTAIRNLIKKNNYLQLLYDLAEGNITEQDYESELDTNSAKYLIEWNKLENPNDVKTIASIVKKIGLEFTVDEVADMFSIDGEDIISNTEALSN